MTKEQLDALLSYIDAAIDTKIEDHARRDSGNEWLKQNELRHELFASFGMREDGTPLDAPDPAPVPVEKPRLWRVVAAPDKGYEHAIQDSSGTYWTFPDGSIWRTGQRRIAAKKARELNAS